MMLQQLNCPAFTTPGPWLIEILICLFMSFWYPLKFNQ